MSEVRWRFLNHLHVIVIRSQTVRKQLVHEDRATSWFSDTAEAVQITGLAADSRAALRHYNRLSHADLESDYLQRMQLHAPGRLYALRVLNLLRISGRKLRSFCERCQLMLIKPGDMKLHSR